ncbi:iron-responsive transcriptional regulator RirA [Antarcticirhabdus aurantiaca]|uniref:Iron-responsive transcriptional regulator RirA n=1 Tax=Antarcticirhabdus aurantiaca TaxID=2606717 RepID=A0ACD4NJQ5_9HYPH|nr:iron-responsive transcriptional regulator RirA [Antarcticirhabdus aurantiaca]WAJ26976.1 iron-responsive transcriptional regulator RirA [Jeongeuplla avenae]
MRLTSQTNYAIRILMYCAANEGRLSRIREIAAANSASELFMFKILPPLVEARMIETVRGRNGGIRLGRPPAEINLRHVVEATEDNFTLAECFETGRMDCPLIDSCELNAALHKALEAFLSALAAYTIADLVRDPSFMRRRLGIPAPDLAAMRAPAAAPPAVA